MRLFFDIKHASAGFRSLSRGLLAALGVGLVLSGCTTTTTQQSFPEARDFGTVVIDAGHGGHDSGALSRRGRRVRLSEKHVALDVAQRVEKKLRDSGLRTVMTRADDRFIPLDTRVAISNSAKRSVFLSVHFNSSRKRSIRGAEVYHNGRGTSELSQRIVSALARLPEGRGRGVMLADFRVLRLSKGPAILVECGYLSNPAESARAASPAYREQIATAIAAAVIEQRR